jgi:hypothetical protein
MRPGQNRIMICWPSSSNTRRVQDFVFGIRKSVRRHIDVQLDWFGMIVLFCWRLNGETFHRRSYSEGPGFERSPVQIIPIAMDRCEITALSDSRGLLRIRVLEYAFIMQQRCAGIIYFVMFKFFRLWCFHKQRHNILQSREPQFVNFDRFDWPRKHLRFDILTPMSFSTCLTNNRVAAR